MGSKLEASKNGFKLTVEVPKNPLPPTKNVFPVPDTNALTNTYLILELVTVGGSGRMGIRARSSLNGLPGENSQIWNLFHTSYQGTAPATLQWESLAITIKVVDSIVNFDYTLTDALPNATHKFYLATNVNNATVNYSVASITTGNDTTVTTLLDMADDGILSAGTEKVALISRYNNAVADKDALIRKAAALSVGYTELSNAFSGLDGYLTGLSPAWNTTTIDTPIDKTTFLSVWNTFDVARAKLATSLQGLTQSLNAATATNQNVSATNVSSFDGYTVLNGNKILLAGQTTTTQNGIYSTAVTSGTSGTARVLPSAGTASGDGTYVNDANAHDNSAGTSATLTSPVDIVGTESVIYSGFSGTGTTGTISAIIAATITGDGPVIYLKAYYSTDGGTTYTLFTNGSFSTSATRTLTAAVSGINLSNLRVKIDAPTAVRRVKSWDNDLMEWYFTSYWSYSVAAIQDVYIDTDAISAGTVTLSKVAEVTDGETYLISNGSTYGGKNATVNRPTTNGAITLTVTTPPFQAVLPTYSAAPAKVLQNTSGVITWETPSAGSGSVAWGGITGTLSSQTDLNSALAGKAASSHTHLIADLPAYPTLSGLGGQAALSGTGFVKSTAGTISYDTSTYSISTHNHTGTYAPAAHSHLIADLPAYPTLSSLNGQPLDADLTAIAGIAGTSGLLKKTAADTWSLDTSTYSLSTHNHTGTYAPAAHSHLIADLPAYPTLSSLGAQASDADLTAIAALSGTSGNLVKTGVNTWTLDTNTYSLTSHDHAGVYSPIGHNHSGVYQPAFSTNTPTGNSFVVISPGNVISYDNNTYSQTNHNHTGTYEPKLTGSGFVKANAGVTTYDPTIYLSSITSANVTTALGYTPYQEGTALDASTITATGNVGAPSFSATSTGYTASSNTTDFIGLTVNQTTTGKAIVKLNTSSKEARVTVCDADTTMLDPSSVVMNNIAGSVLFTDSANVPFGSIGSAGIVTKGPIKAYGATFSAPVDFALNVAQTVNGLKFFNSNGTNTNYIYTAGAGGLNFRNNADSANVASISNTGALTAASLAITGGASTSFLKADGSVDSNAYSLTSHTHAGLGAGTVTSVSGTGAVSGLTLTGTVTSTGSLTLGGSITGFQPVDADLTAIAALAGTSGLLKKTAADTWSLDTTTYYYSGNLPAYPTLSSLGALATNGSAASLTNFPTLNQNTTGTATNLSGGLLFNNMGQSHGTQTDFNAVTDFGFRYVQGATNGPGTGSGQFYGMTLGLGSDYSIANYALQVAIPRGDVTDNYISLRRREATAWSSWSKISAGYADSAGSVAWTNVSSRPTNLSSFTNDLGNYGGWITSSGTAANISNFTNSYSVNPLNGSTYTGNGIGYCSSVSLFGQGDGGLYSANFSSAWSHQIFGDFRTGQIAIRGQNSGTWQAWRTVIDSGNIASQTVATAGNLTGHAAGYAYADGGTSSACSGNAATSTYAHGLHRNDDTSDYNVQPNWTGTHWHLKGYLVDVYHAGCMVDYATSAGSVAWTGVSGRPTNLSSFTNDLGNYGSWITASGSCSYATSAGSATNAALATEAGKLTVGSWDNNKIHFFTNTLDGPPDTAAIEIREYNRGGVGTGVAGEAPTIGFHWSGRIYSHFGLDSSGVLSHWNHTRTAYAPIRCSTLYAASDVQSPSFTATTGFTATSNTADYIGLTVNQTTTGRALIKFLTSSKDAQIGMADGAIYMDGFSAPTAGSLIFRGSAGTNVNAAITPEGQLFTRTNLRVGGTAYVNGAVVWAPNVVVGAVSSNSGGGTIAYPFLNSNGTSINYIYTGSSGLLFRNTADTAQIASLTDAGVFTAANFSGSSSGTNTGDQTLPTWSTLSGKPTNLSSFTNDLGNYGGWITSSGTSAAVTINYNNDSASTYQMLWGSGNSVYGTAGIYCNPSTDIVYATDFSASSDKRLKKEITPITNALDKISKITGVNYKWNDLSTSEDKETIQAGVIAQEVLEVFPEAVNTDNEYMSVSYDKLVPLLIQGMKEQQEQIKQQQEQINSLLAFVNGGL